MPKDKPTISLAPRELADLYALHTFYKWLVEQDSGTDIGLDPRVSFVGDSDKTARQIPSLLSDSIDLVVTTVSDLSCYAPKGEFHLGIDISILKNAVVPQTAEQKAELRKQYGIDPKKPLLVVGYDGSTKAVDILVEQLHRDCEIILVGSLNLEDHTSETTQKNATLVSKYGVLRDFYAMADIAVNAANLFPSKDSLHNFIEATEGGPLFMVPSIDTAQYGYRQLTARGVIRECKDFEDLIKQVRQYAKKFTGDDQDHRAKRAEHLWRTREHYLPLINGYIQGMLGREGNFVASNLVVEEKGRSVIVMHPETRWINVKQTLESDWYNPKQTKLLEYEEALEPIKKPCHTNNLKSLEDFIGYRPKYSPDYKIFPSDLKSSDGQSISPSLKQNQPPFDPIDLFHQELKFHQPPLSDFWSSSLNPDKDLDQFPASYLLYLHMLPKTLNNKVPVASQHQQL